MSGRLIPSLIFNTKMKGNTMKKLFILALIALMASISLAANTRKQIRFVDENGDARTDITSVTVRDVGTTTSSTLTTTEAGGTSITNPMTTTSTNTGLDAGNGIIIFNSAASSYDLQLTINGFDVNLYTIPATKKSIMIPFMTGPVAETILAGTDVTYTTDITTSGMFTTATDHASALWTWGSTGTNGLDLIWQTHTAGAELTLDAGADTITADGVDMVFNDGDFLYFGDDLDFSATSGSAGVLTWATLLTNSTAIINYGADTDGIDLKLFGITTGAYALWDASGDALWIDKADIAFSESDGLLFGDTLGTGDIRIDSTSALLTIGQVAAGTGSVAAGVDDAGLDWTFYGDTTLVNMKWTTASNLLAFTGQVNVATFEGTTVDAVDTILAVADPTVGNQVWTLPDLAVADTVAVMASTLVTNAPGVANSVTGGTNQLVLEGATGGDGFQTIVTPVDATADRTITIPDATGAIELGTVATTVITADTTATITVVPGTDGLFTYTIDSDNEDCTLTFSAGGTAGDIVTIIFDAGAASGNDEIMTFHTTLANVEGTLTLANVANGRYVIVFISDGTVWNEISRTAVLS